MRPPTDGGTSVLTDREIELYKRFLNGGLLEEKETDEVQPLASMGIVRLGISKTKDGYKETARLTPLGEDLLKRDQILRRPIKKFFYRLLNI